MTEDVQDRLAHCHRGLCNAQETIRFIDTKNGVVLSIAVALTGWLTTRATTLVAPGTVGGWLGWLAFALALLGLLAVAFSVVLSIRSLCAQPPPEKAKHLVLFPFVEPGNWSLVQEAYGKKVQELNHVEMLDEYARQLPVLGAICHRKMRFHRLAIGCLTAHILCLIVMSGLLMLGMALKKTPQPGPRKSSYTPAHSRPVANIAKPKGNLHGLSATN
jgi:hypothetical protein